MRTTTDIQTVKEVRESQVAWVDWMQEACEGLADSVQVAAVRRHTPFGTFLLAIHRL